MTIIQYYFHLLLNSRYSFIIKIVIIFSIYMLFYADNINDIAYCAKKKGTGVPILAEAKSSTSSRLTGDVFSLERIRIHEKIVAYTNMEPDELIRSITRLKTNEAKEIGVSFKALSTPLHEKKYIQDIIPPVHKHQLFEGRYGGHSLEVASIPDEAGARKVYYLLRMHRRLNGSSI